MKPFPIIVSSPSGGGKTTIARELLRRRKDLGYSVSCTTRSPRDGEKNGIDYHFLSREEFRSGVERGDFAEHAEVHGEAYGTLRREVAAVLGSGRHVIMDIDVQGARELARSLPDAVLIFVLPPSAGVLVQRLKARKTEAPAALARRLETAVRELREVPMYHYVVVNDDLPKVVDRVSAIIDAEGVRPDHVDGLSEQVQRLIDELQSAIEPLKKG